MIFLKIGLQKDKWRIHGRSM